MNILITGASRGIGYYTALNLASISTNHVFAVSRDESGLDRLMNEHKLLSVKGKLTICIWNFQDDEFLKALGLQIENEVSSLNILINNAGYLRYLPFEELTTTDWKSIYEANVFGPVNLIRSMLNLLKKSDSNSSGGIKNHIVNISSIGGVQGSVKFNGLSAYSSSKGALCVLTECLAEEFKEENIAVNCLALGSVQTEMFTQAFPGFTASQQPKEIGNYIAGFAMEGSRFYNGKVLEVSVSTP